jgi:hypothetical protein
MKVQELIHLLEDLNPDSDVKLAIQPQWAFQHSISDVIEVEDTPDGLIWGVVTIDRDNEHDFEESEVNTHAAATDHCSNLKYDMRRNGDESPIKVAYVGALENGDLISEEDALELCEDMPSTVFIAEGGQDCYLPETVNERLGWSRR